MGGNGTQDGALLYIQSLTRHLWWKPELLPVERAVQQMIGDLTHHDLVQRGKQRHELLHDKVMVPGECEPAEELEGVEMGRSPRPGPGKLLAAPFPRRP